MPERIAPTWPDDGQYGLTLRVAGRLQPGLQVLVASHGRMLLTQGSEPVLLAKVLPRHSAVKYYTTGRFRPPLAPIHARKARSVGLATDEGWNSRWVHYVASALESHHRGPLHAGDWLLTATATRLEHTPWATSTAERWATLLLSDNPGEIDWFARQGGWQVLPLRHVSDADDARVKAYRKLARDGVLPPVLLWWISALDSYVILDGHDRLSPPSRRGRSPLMALARIDMARVEHATDLVVERFAADQNVRRPLGERAADQSRRLAAVLTEIRTDYHRTQARPLPGGTGAWDALAKAREAEWYEQVRWFLDAEEDAAT